MRLCSRETFVGFLLVFSLVVIGCQPVQPISATSSIETDRETEAISETVSSATIPAPVTVTESITATQVVTISAGTEADAAADTRGETASSGAIVPADPAVLAVGMAVYRAQYCGVCHTLDTAETRGTFGPVHNGMGHIAAERILEPTYSGTARNAAEYIRESIVDPQLFIVPGYATTSHRMPSYAHIEGESLDALVAFLLAQ